MNTYPDFYKEPFLEYCDKCKEYVISIQGHCINDDNHLTKVLTPDERKEILGDMKKIRGGESLQDCIKKEENGCKVHIKRRHII